MTNTSYYPQFSRSLFPNVNEAVAWENMQHELYRKSGSYTVVRFTRNLNTGKLVTTITDITERQVLVEAFLDIDRDEITVHVYDDKRPVAYAKFDNWEHPLVSEAVVAFINRAAER